MQHVDCLALPAASAISRDSKLHSRAKLGRSISRKVVSLLFSTFWDTQQKKPMGKDGRSFLAP